MRATRGDRVVFTKTIGKEKKRIEGIVTGGVMGKITIMSKGGSQDVIASEIVENKGPIWT